MEGRPYYSIFQRSSGRSGGWSNQSILETWKEVLFHSFLRTNKKENTGEYNTLRVCFRPIPLLLAAISYTGYSRRTNGFVDSLPS